MGRINVTTPDGDASELILPTDIDALGQVVEDTGAVLVLLDPLISRLDRKLDSHKDAEVRRALEPIVRLAHTTGASVLGIIHVNKGASRDASNLVMSSRAFVAVPRQVHIVAQDPDEEQERLVGIAKNNLGHTDLSTLRFRIRSVVVGQTADGRAIDGGKLEWLGKSDQSIREVVEESTQSPSKQVGATFKAGTWLQEFLVSRGGWEFRTAVQEHARQAGHSESTIKRAKAACRIPHKSIGPRGQTVWWLPGSEPEPLAVAEREEASVDAF